MQIQPISNTQPHLSKLQANFIGESVSLSLIENIKGLCVKLGIFGNWRIPSTHIFQYMKIQKLTDALAKECHVDKKIDIQLRYAPLIFASAYMNYINFDPLFYVDWDALPKHLRISNIHDPKLQDRKFYTDFFHYLSQELKFSLDREVDVRDILHLQFFIHARQDPQKSYSAFRTMIAHELGHIQHRDHLKHTKKFNWLEYNHKIIYALVLPIIYTMRTLSTIYIARKCETAADYFAGKHLLDAGTGAAYGFGCVKKAIETTKKCDALTLKEKILLRLTMPLNEGSICGMLTHGTLSGRIHCITNANQHFHRS